MARSNTVAAAAKRDKLLKKCDLAMVAWNKSVKTGDKEYKRILKPSKLRLDKARAAALVDYDRAIEPALHENDIQRAIAQKAYKKITDKYYKECAKAQAALDKYYYK